MTLSKKSYDAVIIGAGLSGLMAANVLSQGDAKVLVIEKNDKIGGNDLPAGTTKPVNNFGFPDHLFNKYSSFQIHTPKNFVDLNSEGLNFYSIKKSALEKWMAENLMRHNVDIRLNSMATQINPHYITSGGENIRFKYLIGADGCDSLVRKYLGLRSEARNFAVFYRMNGAFSCAQFHLAPKYFKTGYVFLIPDKEFTYAGCGVDLREKTEKEIINIFKKWLEIKKIQIDDSRLYSGIMNHDFKGYEFGNIFLAGDAGGFGLGLTGEGVYPALLSGQEIGKKILNPDYLMEKLDGLISLKKKQIIMRRLLASSDIINTIFIEMFVKLMKITSLQKKLFLKL